MFALICVRYRYAIRLHDQVGISWIDNESAKYACIKGTSLSHSMLVMCRVLQQVEAELPSSVWYERVSSHSNPGDLPSRNQVKRASKLFQVGASFESCGCMRNHMVLSTLSSKGSKPVRQTPNKDECPRRRVRFSRVISIF